MQKEESPTTQNKLLEEAYERAVNGNRWKKIQDFLQSSQTSLFNEDQQKYQKQKIYEDSGLSKSQNGQNLLKNQQKDQLYTNNYIIKRPLIKQTATSTSSAVKSSLNGFNNQKYLNMIDNQNSQPVFIQVYDPNISKPSTSIRFYDVPNQNLKQEDAKLKDQNIIDNFQKQKENFKGFSEYDNKSLDTKSQITQITDTNNSYVPNSQLGTHLKKKSFNNSKSFQKFKSPLLNQKDIDMHLKDINNQYVVEGVKESKFIIKNEMNNQFKSSMQSNLKSSMQISTSQDLLKKVIQKQKLMTIQQNVSQDVNSFTVLSQQQKIQNKPQIYQQQIYTQQYNIDANDQDSQNAYASKYQSLKSYQGQNIGNTGSNQKSQIKSDLDVNLEFSKNLVNDFSTSEFNSKKNSISQIKTLSTKNQKLMASKKILVNRPMNIKSSREETSYNRQMKQLQFDQQNQPTIIEPFIKKQQTYSDNLSAYELNQSNNFSQNIKDSGSKQYNQSNYANKQPVNQNQSKGVKELFQTQKLVSYQQMNCQVRKIVTPLRQKSTISDNLSKKAQNIQTALLGEYDIKKELVESFQKMKLDVYSDILRIKKPQASAYIVGQLLCKTVNSFRGGQNKQMGFDSKFQEWETIQEYVLYHSGKSNQINLNYEQKLNFEEMRSRSNNMRSDNDKTSTQRSLISQNLFQKSDLSTNLINDRTESQMNRDQSERRTLKQSASNKKLKKKSPPKINDQMVESVNSLCTPKNSLGFKANILQSRENKTDMIRKSNIRKEDGFQAISKQKNFQYLNDSFQNEKQAKNEEKYSPIKDINDNINQGQLNKLTASQNYSFVQPVLNQNPFTQNKQRIEKQDKDIIIESKNEYFEKIQIQTGKDSKRSLISNQKLAQGSFYFTPQGKNIQEFGRSDKSSYQINPQITKKLKVFDRLSMSSVQRKRLQQQSTGKISPQKQNQFNQENNTLKSAADQVKINIMTKKVMNYQNDQSIFNIYSEKENLMVIPQNPQNQDIIQICQSSPNSYIRNNLQYGQEVTIEQEDRNSPNKFPETYKEKGSQFIQSQSLSNPQLIVQFRQHEVQKSSPQQLQHSLMNSYNKVVYNPDIQINSQRQTIDQTGHFNQISVQQSQKRLRKSRQERSTGNKSVNKDNKQQKNETLLNKQKTVQINQSNQNVIQIHDNTLNEFVEIEKNLSQVQQDKNQIEKIRDFEGETQEISKTADQIDIFNQMSEQQLEKIIQNEYVQNADESINEILGTFENHKQSKLNNENQQIEQSNLIVNLNQSNNEVKIINTDESQNMMFYNSDEYIKDKIDYHFQEAYNSIIQLPHEIFQIQNFQQTSQDQNIEVDQVKNDEQENMERYENQQGIFSQKDEINEEGQQSNEECQNSNEEGQKSNEEFEEQMECYLDPVEEAHRIIGIIKAELESEDNEVPQVQQLTLTKIDQTQQHVRSNSTMQNSNSKDWNNSLKNETNNLHKKHQTLIAFNPEFCDSDFQDNSQPSIDNQQSNVDSKLKNQKKLKYLEIIRNKIQNIDQNINETIYNAIDDKSCSEKTLIENQKFQQNILLNANPFKNQNELKQNNYTLSKSYELSEEPQTAQIHFTQQINQIEVIPFEQISEKQSNQDDQEPFQQNQFECQNEIEDIIIDKRSQNNNQTEQKIQKSEKRSSEEEQFYMQEIVSPFRKLRTSQMNNDARSQSPIKNEIVQEPGIVLENFDWEINPVKVKMQQLEEQEQQKSQNSEDQFFERQLGLRNEEDENNSDEYNNNVEIVDEMEQSVDISPGKLKSNVRESRKHIIERIDETMKEIQQNSPTRNSLVNIDMIQKLKQRRLNQKIKSDMDLTLFDNNLQSQVNLL